MQTKIIPIGTSKGIRIPKYLLSKYGFNETIEMNDTGSGVLLSPTKASRKGWDKYFNKAAGTKDDKLIDAPSPKWDEEEWEW